MVVLGFLVTLIAFDDLKAVFAIPPRISLLMSSVLFPFLLTDKLRRDSAIVPVTERGLCSDRAKIALAFVFSVGSWVLLLLASARTSLDHTAAGYFNPEIIFNLIVMFIGASISFGVAIRAFGYIST